MIVGHIFLIDYYYTSKLLLTYSENALPFFSFLFQLSSCCQSLRNKWVFAPYSQKELLYSIHSFSWSARSADQLAPTTAKHTANTFQPSLAGKIHTKIYERVVRVYCSKARQTPFVNCFKHRLVKNLGLARSWLKKNKMDFKAEFKISVGFTRASCMYTI